MNYYKRHETFRYDFEQPIACFFKIGKFEEENEDSKIARGFICNLSPGGLKLSTPLKIILDKKIEIEILFKINENEISLPGELIWNKPRSDSDFYYGVKLHINESMQKILTSEIKLYSKRKSLQQ